VVPGEKRPAKALEGVRLWLDGADNGSGCRTLAAYANDAIQGLRDESAKLGEPRRHGPVGLVFPAEAAAYAARDVAVAVVRPAPNDPKWVAPDQAAIHSGHAACSAMVAATNPLNEQKWQTQRLIELILAPSPATWAVEAQLDTGIRPSM
jgi:hypothetical protein